MIENDVRPESAPELTPERRALAIEGMRAAIAFFQDQTDRSALPGWYQDRIDAYRAAIGFLEDTADLIDHTPDTCPACDGELSVDEYNGDGGSAWEVSNCDDCAAVAMAIGVYYRLERLDPEVTP